MKKRVFIVVLLIASFSLIACSSSENEQETKIVEATNDNEESEQEGEDTLTEAKSEASLDDTTVSKINIDDIQTMEEVEAAYVENFEFIQNKEDFRKLDINSVDFNTVISYAERSITLLNTVEDDSMNTKIDGSAKIVSVDNLDHNTSQVVMEEVAVYVIGLWESDMIITDNSEELLINLYLTRYLDKRLDNHPNLEVVDDVIFDIYQIIKDTLREDTSSIDANTEQINNDINNVKSLLGIS